MSWIQTPACASEVFFGVDSILFLYMYLLKGILEILHWKITLGRLYRVYYQPWRPILQFVRLIIWEREREREYRICGSLLYSIIIFVSKIEKLYLASRERRMYFKHRNIYVFAFVLHFDLCSYLIGRLKALSAQSMVSVGLWVSALALIYKSSSISIFLYFSTYINIESASPKFSLFGCSLS